GKGLVSGRTAVAQQGAEGRELKQSGQRRLAAARRPPEKYQAVVKGAGLPRLAQEKRDRLRAHDGEEGLLVPQELARALQEWVIPRRFLSHVPLPPPKQGTHGVLVLAPARLRPEERHGVVRGVVLQHERQGTAPEPQPRVVPAQFHVLRLDHVVVVVS